MKYDPERHHRRSTRLKGFDYSQANVFYVTVCVHQRWCLLSEIQGGEVRLNPAGEMVLQVWDQMPEHYPGVDVDAFVVMPNHVHGIIVLGGLLDHSNVGAALLDRPIPSPDSSAEDQEQTKEPEDQPIRESENQGQARGPAPTGGLSLPDVMHRFKTLTTTLYIRGVKNLGWPAFDGRFWQRNYHDRVIRDEDELNAIREYIANNPLNWDMDEEKPL